MLTVDKELLSGKFKLNVFKSDYLSTEFVFVCFEFENVLLINNFFFHIPHSGHQRFKVTFRPNGNSTWLSFPL